MRPLVRITVVIIVCGATLVYLSHTRRKEPHPGPYTATELQGDYGQLWSEMRANHPALYQFTDVATFDRFIETQFGKLEHEMTIEEFYEIVKTTLARIGCSHTRVSMPDGYWMDCPGRMFPLELVFLPGGAYSVGHYGDTSGPPRGSEIVAINGVPMWQITENLKQGVSSDFFDDGRKYYRLNRAFVYLYALFYGYPGQFKIGYRAPGRADSLSAAHAPAGLDDIKPSPDPRNATGKWVDENLGLDILAGRDAAVMTIKTFSYYDHLETFYSFVDLSFEEIRNRGIGNLIIDLRGNDGGDPFCTTHLLAHIEPEPVRYFARKYGRYAKFADPIPPASNRFEGRLLVLIDGGCSSSTGHLCAVLAYNNIGTFVGSPTGATYECNDASKSVILHNTGLDINMPRMTFTAYAPGLARDRGIEPHHSVERTVEDLVNGRDTVLEYALDLIERGPDR